MFAVYILAFLVALCSAFPQGTVLLERDSNYALPRNYELPSYEKLLELYQAGILKTHQEEHLIRPWVEPQVYGIAKNEPHHRIPVHQPLHLPEVITPHHQQENHHKPSRDPYDHSHGHKIIVSDHDILIEFSRLKLLAKEAEHYFRPEFDGHKLRHQDLIAYIEELLKFGAERDQRRKQNEDRRNIDLERQNEERYINEQRHELEKHIPKRVIVSEEHKKQKSQIVSEIEHSLIPHEEHIPPVSTHAERPLNKKERRPQHIQLEKSPIHEVVKAPLIHKEELFEPYEPRNSHKQIGLPEHGTRVVCINCGSHYKQ